MYHGNHAYQLEIPAPTIKKAITARPNAKLKGNVRYKVTYGMKLIALVLTIFAIMFGVCARYVAIYNQSSEITRKKSELAKINAQNSQIQMAIEKDMEKTELNAYATNVLGMIKPDKGQYVYIKIKNADAMVSSDMKAATPQVTSMISDGIAKMVEYFKY